MTRMAACFLYVVASVALAAKAEAVECTSNRPGWGDHRTLYVPEWMLENEDNDNDAWMEALCCVYTYVMPIATSSSSVRFELYDGSDYRIRNKNSFQEVASQAMEDICDMQMGSVDCRNQAACVERALATHSPTIGPTESPTTTTSLFRNTLVVNFTAARLEEALNCTSDRPGWAGHRTLYVPEPMLSCTNATTNSTVAMTRNETDVTDAIAWIDALCCVYTHVKIVPATTARASKQAQLKVYDDYTYSIPGSLLSEVARNAMSDICGMSMGSQDCRRQAECVDVAFSLNTTNTSATIAPGGRRTELVSSKENSFASEGVSCGDNVSWLFVAALLACSFAI